MPPRHSPGPVTSKLIGAEQFRYLEPLTLVGVNREGLAFSAASGIYAGGKTPLILIQNTGLMESGDSMRGWAMQMEVPVVLMVYVNVIVAAAVRCYAALGLLLAGAGALAARPLVALLYGDAYGEVVLPLQVMVVVGGLTLIEAAFGALLSTTDNQKLRVGFVVLSLLVTATLAIFLVPRYGLHGAVAAHAASRLLVFAVTWAGIARVLQLRMPWPQLLRLVSAAAMAMVPALLLERLLPDRWGGLAAAVAYVPVYIAASVAFRAWHRDDAQVFAGLARRFPRLGALAVGCVTRLAGRGGLP